MTLDPSRLAFVLRDQRIATSETRAVSAKHGNLARVIDEPVDTYFDDLSSAQVIADQRQMLFGVERRRFSARASGLDEVLNLDMAGGVTPTCEFVDEKRDISRRCLVAEIGFDFGKQQANLLVWG